MNILIKDEQLNGTITNQFEIEIEQDMISTQELIERRVLHEVNAYNNKRPEFYNGLVEPSEAERTLNGFRLNPKNQIDVKAPLKP